MKIKVSFTKVVEADSVDDAYAKVLGCLDALTDGNSLSHDKTTYKRGNTEFTEMYGFVFEGLGGHSGYGEGSIEDWTDTD